MSVAALPRVTYSNVTADFGPLHDHLDSALPGFRASFGRFWPNIIGDQVDDDGVRFSTVSPIDDRIVIGEFVAASPGAVDRAIRAAKAAQPAWGALPWRERVATLRRLAEVLRARRFEFGMACLYEVGKSRLESMGEAEEAIDLISYYCDEMERNEGYARAMARAFPNEATQVVLRPVGVFGVIAPFNFPLALSVGMMTGALLGGNAVVYKPSAKACLTGAMLMAICEEAGLPSGLVSLLCGEGAGRHLADHPGVDGIAFTGSHAVGMEIYRKVAAGPFARPVIVEMGGKNPAYVTAAADLDAAAEGVMRSAFGLQGQKCSACSVVYVEAPVLQTFVDVLAEKTSRIVIGTPEQRDVYMGPLIGPDAGERFLEAVAHADHDGQVVRGGTRLRGGAYVHGWYAEPTVVTGLPSDHKLNRDELFLPFLSVVACNNLAEGIAHGNAVGYGLTAGIYSRDHAEIERFLATAEAGVLYANRRSGATTGAWPGIQTFCGWKGSGVTNKGGLGPFYVPQFMREQSHTLWEG